MRRYDPARRYSCVCPACSAWRVVKAILPDGSSQRHCTACDWRGRIVRDVARNATAYAAPGFPGETRDCSVRAHAVAACVAYEEAHELYQRHGRPDFRSTPFNTTCAAMREVGAMKPDRTLGTVGAFVKAHPVGHYVVHVRRHAIAIVDGVVHDWSKHTSGARRRVHAAWRLDV